MPRGDGTGSFLKTSGLRLRLTSSPGTWTIKQSPAAGGKLPSGQASVRGSEGAAGRPWMGRHRPCSNQGPAPRATRKRRRASFRQGRTQFCPTSSLPWHSPCTQPSAHSLSHLGPAFVSQPPPHTHLWTDGGCPPQAQPTQGDPHAAPSSRGPRRRQELTAADTTGTVLRAAATLGTGREGHGPHLRTHHRLPDRTPAAEVMAGGRRLACCGAGEHPGSGWPQ